MSEQAVTGKPMTYYEPFVELVSTAIANGIANLPELIRDGKFDPRRSLESQTRDLAMSFIKWRGAFMIDDALEQTRESDGTND